MSDDTPSPAAVAIERRALQNSTIAYLGMAVLGFGFALTTRSEAILLDGTYSFISFGASILATGVARLVAKPGSRRFHFGYAHFEPLLNMIRGFLIVGIASFALFSAVDALLHGGRPITPGLAVLYGAVAAAGCLFMAWNQKRLSRKAGSPLLQVDSRNWLVDGVLSLGAFLAFVTALILDGTSAAHLVPYVDPTLVTVMVVAVVRVPLITIWENLREVLQVAPSGADQDDVRERIRGALTDLPVRDVQTRMVKVGRFFYVLTHVVLPDDYEPRTVKALDEARCQIVSALDDVPLKLVTDTVFTAEEHWATAVEHRGCEPDGEEGGESEAGATEEA